MAMPRELNDANTSPQENKKTQDGGCHPETKHAPWKNN